MRAAALLALALLAACDGGGATAPDPGGSNAPLQRAPAPERRPVVAEAIAALESELAPAPAPPADPELGERVRGLLGSAAGRDPRLARAAREELAGLGEPPVPWLAEVLLDREAPGPERRAAAEALGALDLPGAVEALLAVLERSRTDVEREPWLYALCAYHVGRTGQDQAVPALLLALRYETDHPTVIWIADSLARFGNLSGVEALWVVAREATEESAREEAAGILARIAGEAGGAGAGELSGMWARGEDLPPEVLSPRHRLELWRQVRALSAWQLRGVDDARFVLSRCREGAAEILARALEDEDRYVRVHAAQCLERMGPRARSTGPALVAALADPELGPQCALALGAIGHAAAEPELRARLASTHPLELRLAAAAALGRLGQEGSAAALLPLLAPGEPIDLRASAAASLLACTPPLSPALRPALELLADQLTAGAVEPTLVEQALHGWLLRAAPLEPAAESAAAEWALHEAAPPSERLAQRAELVRDLLLRL